MKKQYFYNVFSIRHVCIYAPSMFVNFDTTTIYQYASHNGSIRLFLDGKLPLRKGYCDSFYIFLETAAYLYFQLMVILFVYFPENYNFKQCTLILRNLCGKTKVSYRKPSLRSTVKISLQSSGIRPKFLKVSKLFRVHNLLVSCLNSLWIIIP